MYVIAKVLGIGKLRKICSWSRGGPISRVKREVGPPSPGPSRPPRGIFYIFYGPMQEYIVYTPQKNLILDLNSSPRPIFHVFGPC